MTDSDKQEKRWRRTPEERPRQILDAALAVFGEAGLAGARLDDVAERAGISKGTIYLYFPSKDELFREVIRDVFAGMLETVHGLPASGDPLSELEAFGRAYWAFLRSPQFETLYRLINAEIQSFPELGRELSTEVREPIRAFAAAILDRGVASGVFAPGDSQIRSRMLLALLWQHGIWCARREFKMDLAALSDAEVLREIFDFFFSAVKA